MNRALQRLYELFAAKDPIIAIAGGILLLYYFLTPGIFEGKASGDGLLGFMYLPGVLLRHSLDLRFTLPERVAALGIELTGRMANPCPIGPALIWAPTYLLGLLLQKLHLVHTPPGQRFGQTTTDFFAAGLGALLFGQIGMAATFRLIRRWLGQKAARFGTITAVLATPLCFYLITQPLYQHACAFAAVALFIEKWDAIQQSHSQFRWALLGALGGFLMLLRIQEAIFFLLPALTLFARILRGLQKRDVFAAFHAIFCGLLFLCMAVWVFLPQLLTWRYFYGFLHPPVQPGHMRWTEPAVIETLFSLRAGLFPWVPVLYLALPGLFLKNVRMRAYGGLLALLFLLGFWVNASAWDYHGSWAFGPRRFTDATLIFAVGLAGVYDWLASRFRGGTRLISALAILLVLYNGLLMELVRTRRIKSSSSGAFTAAVWVGWAHGPNWLAQAFTRIGYPFAQPAGWIYAAIYKIPKSAFEGIVGNYFLERNWRFHHVVTGQTQVSLQTPSPYLFVEDDPSGNFRRRLLIPLFAAEPLEVRLYGRSARPGNELALIWNGAPMNLQRNAKEGFYSALIPASQVHIRGRLNEVRVIAPAGVSPSQLELISHLPWRPSALVPKGL